jgi:hypothetical protein
MDPQPQAPTPSMPYFPPTGSVQLAPIPGQQPMYSSEIPSHPGPQPHPPQPGHMHPLPDQIHGPAATMHHDYPPTQTQTQTYHPAYQMADTIQPPVQTMSPLVTSSQDIRTTRTSAQFALREYMSLQRKRQQMDPTGSMASLDIDERIRAQAGMLSSELRTLREQVSLIVKAAESHRWRRWLIGGIM